MKSRKMQEKEHLETREPLTATAHILIEVYVARRNAGPLEMILHRCCQEAGDRLLAKDGSSDGLSVRYTVLLIDHEHARLSRHITVLIAALKEGLLGFACKSVPLLVEVQLPPQVPAEAMLAFPLKEPGSERYRAYAHGQTFYLTRPYDYMLAPEQRAWIEQRQAQYRVL